MMIPSWLKRASSLLLVLLLPVDAFSAETRAHPLVENDDGPHAEPPASLERGARKNSCSSPPGTAVAGLLRRP